MTRLPVAKRDRPDDLTLTSNLVFGLEGTAGGPDGGACPGAVVALGTGPTLAAAEPVVGGMSGSGERIRDSCSSAACRCWAYREAGRAVAGREGLREIQRDCSRPRRSRCLTGARARSNRPAPR